MDIPWRTYFKVVMLLTGSVLFYLWTDNESKF
jgi:hypothetical protein